MSTFAESFCTVEFICNKQLECCSYSYSVEGSGDEVEGKDVTPPPLSPVQKPVKAAPSGSDDEERSVHYSSSGYYESPAEEEEGYGSGGGRVHSGERREWTEEEKRRRKKGFKLDFPPVMDRERAESPSPAGRETLLLFSIRYEGVDILIRKDTTMYHHIVHNNVVLPVRGNEFVIVTFEMLTAVLMKVKFHKSKLDHIYTFQRDTQCSSTDCLLMLRCQLYMFLTVTVHPQELLFRCCMCRLWYVL